MTEEKKPMMRRDEIRTWMIANVHHHLYVETPVYDIVGKVDTTSLYEGFLSFADERPSNDEDHPAFWIAVDVAAEYDLAHEND